MGSSPPCLITPNKRMNAKSLKRMLMTIDKKMVRSPWIHRKRKMHQWFSIRSNPRT